MKRHDEMPAKRPARQTDVANYADKPTAWYKNAVTFAPDESKLCDKFLVIFDVAKLTFEFVIALQYPVRGGGYDKVNALIFDEREIARVAFHDCMVCYCAICGYRLHLGHSPPYMRLQTPREYIESQIVCRLRIIGWVRHIVI